MLIVSVTHVQIPIQECIGFVDKRHRASGRLQTGSAILQDIFQGYTCFFFSALSSHTHPHPKKWLKFGREATEKQGGNFLPDDVEAQQGSSDNDISHFLYCLMSSIMAPPLEGGMYMAF